MGTFPVTSSLLALSHSQDVRRQENADTFVQVSSEAVYVFLILPLQMQAALRVSLAGFVFSPATNSAKSLPLCFFSVSIKMFSVPTMKAHKARYGFNFPTESPAHYLKAYFD